MKELPKFTEGPWYWNRYRSAISQQNPTMPPDDTKKSVVLLYQGNNISYKDEDAHLIAASPLLYMALWAQEVASEIQKENMLKVSASDERYTPFIGTWDGKQSTEDRFWAFQAKRRQLRTEALKQARGE